MITDVLRGKHEVFGSISAYRTLLNDYPEIDINASSFPSINNSTDQIEYITDLFTTLGSIDDLLNTLSKIIVNKLDYIELSIKEILKRQIKNYISCNIDPSILDQLVNDGVDLPIKSIDIFNLMRKHPKDPDGSLFYFDVDDFDVNELFKSKDFNVFLWYVINMSTTPMSWGRDQIVFADNLAKLEFKDTPIQADEYHNTVNFKIDGDYASRNKLTNFNSDFIDSVKLFDKKEVVGKIFSRIFGSGDFSIKRTQEELLLQKQIEDILNKITNEDSETVIDDSFFTFSNQNQDEMLRTAELKKRGLLPFQTDELTMVMVSTEDILEALGGFNDSTPVEQEEIFINTVDKMVNQTLTNNGPELNPRDKFNFRVNLIKSLTNELSSLMMMTIMSPKVYIILAVNLKLMGVDIESNPTDFIKNNYNLVSDVVKEIKDQILDELVGEITNMATDLAMRMAQDLLKNQAMTKMKILKSFTI